MLLQNILTYVMPARFAGGCLLLDKTINVASSEATDCARFDDVMFPPYCREGGRYTGY